MKISSCLTIQTPIGLLGIYGCKSITKIAWTNQHADSRLPELRKAQDQITAYFAGSLFRFDLLLEPSGTIFQLKVWEHILAIPYGQTLNYGELAIALSTSPRAIGGACARNPIPLLVPCHRVIGKNGALKGYTGGEGRRTKQLLLSLEQTATAHTS
jgi:methylated-DNA-[protein]-cysteine S-methyltransferase